VFNSAYGVIINDEINCPNNKYIKHFLWTSYFHDSEIIDIELERKYSQKEEYYGNLPLIKKYNGCNRNDKLL